MSAPHRQGAYDASIQAKHLDNRAPLPRRLKSYAPKAVINNTATVPAPTAKKIKHVIQHYGKDAKTFVPTEYTRDTGPKHMPGTAKYYKSYAFQKKKNTGYNLVPGGHSDAAAHAFDNADVAVHQKSAKSEKPKSLVMIMSWNSARRASDKRTVHRRLQRFNRRMKFRRSVTGETAHFEWD